MNSANIPPKVHQIQFSRLYRWGNAVLSVILCFMFTSAVLAQDQDRSYVLNSRIGEKIDLSEQDFAEKLNKEGTVRVITAQSGIEKVGPVLYVTDSLLVMWRSNEPYNLLEWNEFAVPLPFYQIERIVIENKGHFWAGSGFGFLVGGAVGAMIGFSSGDDEEGFFRYTAESKALMGGLSLGLVGALTGGIIGVVQGIDDSYIINGNGEKYKAVAPVLKKNAIFPSVPPPELQALLRQGSKQLLLPIIEPVGQTNKSFPSPSPAKLHLSIAGMLKSTAANNDIIEAFNSSGFGGTVGGWFGPTDYPVDQSIPFSWNIATEYNFTKHFRSGLEMSKIPQQEVHGKDLEFEYAHGTSYGLLFEYVPAPATPLFISRFEFAMGAGLSYNSLSVDGTLSSAFGSAIFGNPGSFAIKKKIAGVYLRGSLDYYLWKTFSIQFKGEGRIIPSVDVPAISYTNPYNNQVKTLKQHHVNFSSIDFSLGFRLHF